MTQPVVPNRRTHEDFILRTMPGTQFIASPNPTDIIIRCARTPEYMRNLGNWLHKWVDEYIMPMAEKAAHEEEIISFVAREQQNQSLAELEAEAQELKRKQDDNERKRKELNAPPMPTGQGVGMVHQTGKNDSHQ